METEGSLSYSRKLITVERRLPESRLSESPKETNASTKQIPLLDFFK
jgi:hypothetical protein